jgi:signal peptidase I
MEKTLIEDDAIVIGKLNYVFSSPKRGDVIAFVLDENVRGSIFNKIKILYQDTYYKFKKEEHRRRLVKRIIGLPGDTINIEDGNVYVNGQKIIENYIEDKTYPRTGFVEFPIDVQKGQVFVLGDNRDVSRDSRNFGCIPYNSIEGKVVFKIYPLSKIGKVK